MSSAKQNLGVTADLGCDLVAQHSYERSRLTKLALKQVRGEAERLGQGKIESALRRVNETRRGSVGVLFFLDARQKIRKILGKHQKVARSLESALEQIVVKLIYGIEGIKLNTRPLVKLGKGNALVNERNCALGTAIAVGKNALCALVCVNEAIIDTPGVDRHTLDARIFCKRRRNARLDISIERGNVPDQVSVAFGDVVRKAVNLVGNDLAARIVRNDSTAA